MDRPRQVLIETSIATSETIMADAQRRTEMTVEEFPQWNFPQAEGCELVDGRALPLRAMAGITGGHDTIAVNLMAEVREQLRGTPCRARTANRAVRTKIKTVRRPDVTIEYPPLETGQPAAVFEVPSPTARKVDSGGKLQGCRLNPGVKVIVHLVPDLMDVIDSTRNDSGDWNDTRLERPEDRIVVPDLPVMISLAEIYDGVPLASLPDRQEQS